MSIPPAVIKLVQKGGGKEAVEALESEVAQRNAKTRIAVLTDRAKKTGVAMAQNLRAVVKDTPNQAVATLIGAGAGAYLSMLGYDYLRGYFGPESKMPDLIIPIAGAVTGFLGASLKDKSDNPGGRAQLRSGLVGLGGGAVLMSFARSYQTWIAA